MTLWIDMLLISKCFNQEKLILKIPSVRYETSLDKSLGIQAFKDCM